MHEPAAALRERLANHGGGTFVGNMAELPPQIDHDNGAADVLLVDFGGGSHGHRGQYNAMLAQLFRLRTAPFGPAMLLSRRAVLVPQIEVAPGRFFMTCLIRAALGLRTVGLLLRPLPALHGTSLRLRIKRAALILLRQLRRVSVLTIIPFAVDPALTRIARGWIHDLQNWDFALGSATDPAQSALTASHVRGAAEGRKVCVAIGGQNREKGFDRFAALWSDNAEMRRAFLFAFGGTVSADLSAAAARFAETDGYALARFVSDAELHGLYQAADLVWCAYDPSYDQASGILGRAMQCGIPVVVRKGSVIERLCQLADHPHITEAVLAQGSALPPSIAPNQAAARARAQGRISLARLAEALGTAPAIDPFAALAPGQMP